MGFAGKGITGKSQPCRSWDVLELLRLGPSFPVSLLLRNPTGTIPQSFGKELSPRRRRSQGKIGEEPVGDLAGAPSRIQAHADPCIASLHTITPKVPGRIRAGPNSCLAHLESWGFRDKSARPWLERFCCRGQAGGCQNPMGMGAGSCIPARRDHPLQTPPCVEQNLFPKSLRSIFLHIPAAFSPFPRQR